ASGEEAYSIAIALLEHLGDRGGITPVQIFATDIDEDAIEKARAGVYPENIAQDVSPERLRRFFLKVEGGYQISKHIRDMCVFATQNVIKDPPFSKVDLISCRNLLIYLGQVLQKKVLTIFHYALNPGGFLQLGSAESIGEFADLFRAVDPKVKLYAKKSIATPQRMDFGSVAAASPPLGASVSSPPPAARSGLDMQREADRLILNKYAPAAVVINEALDILQFRGQTGAYLEPAPGEASLNLLKMAREGLRSALNTAVRNAKRRHTTTRSAGVNIRYDGRMRTLDIEVMPIPGTATSERCYLVVFQEAQVAVTKGQTSKGKRSPQKQDHKVTELEQELISTKEYLQSVIEQQETSNEELRSANEEIQSSNEELQSINEELETTKEELQSTNEELATVNDELGSRNFELSQLNNDLNNLIGSVNLAIVIVGLDLCIRRYTPQMEKLLNLIASDIGRPITDIRLNFEMPHLAKQISETIDAVRSQQIEIQDHSGRWYSLRIMPYKTLDNQITGAILVFVDVDELKKGMEQARTARDYAESIISAMRHPLLVLDKHLRVVSASTAYLDTFQVNAHATLGNLLYRLGNGQWGVPTLRAALEATISQGTAFEDFSITHDFENIGPRTVLISGRPIAVGPTNAPLVLMQIEMVASHAIDGV
ncbi:MAG: PAS domain-containing protein, partial [Gammaproteobacteria bacterium]|nr:PAS domain-containing protein [Gammaproteobacteria bacterium]